LKLPRDISGTELAALLGQYDYESTRQTGSHLRLTSRAKGAEHHVTVPLHSSVKVGTLARIVADVATYLELDRELLAKTLFGR
jgi:predicted RNA binding protein YcfA (HicA-like mRNA interferase family)